MFSLELAEAKLGNLQNFVGVVVGSWSPNTFPYFRCGFSSSVYLLMNLRLWSGRRDGVGSHGLGVIPANPSQKSRIVTMGL